MSTKNKLYDVIIVGASEEGLNFCTQLKNKAPNAKIAFISKHFNFRTKKHNLEGVDIFEKEAVFSYYRQRLLGIYTADREGVFGKAIVLATGSKPTKSTFKNTNIRYNIEGIKPSKNTAAVVFGDSNLAASYAIQLAKKFKYIYLCSNSISLNCDSKYIKKIENIANIVHLPNCNITACKNDKEGNLSEIQLDTYSSIKCSTLVMCLGRSPEVSGIDKRIVKLDSEGYIVTKEFCETTEIPNIFAIGACTKNSKTKILPVVNKLMSRLKLEEN